MTSMLPRLTLAAERQPRLRRLLLPLLVGIAGFAVSLPGITTASVWYDEAATITSATRSWSQLAEMVGTVDAVHAAYYVLMHLVFDLVGYSPLSLRLPSAIAVGVTAALLVVLGRQFGRQRLGVIAAIVFIVLPRTTWMATEGRSYAITALLAVVLTIALVHAVHTRSRRAWVLYAVAVVVSCVVFIYLALIVVAQAVALLWWWAGNRRTTAPALRRWTASIAVAALVVTPFALIVMGQSGQVHWLPATGADTVEQVLLTQWYYTSVPFAVVGWALTVVGCVLLVRRRGLSLGALVVPAIVVPTALLVAVSVAMPLYTPRYASMCLPFVALAIGAALDRVPSRVPIVVAIAALVALAIPQAVEQRQPEAREYSAWQEVSDWIATDRTSGGDAAFVYGNVYGHPTATARVIAYAYPEGFADSVDATIATPAAETGQLWETTLPLATTLDRLDPVDSVYLVTSTSRDQRPAVTATLLADGWRIAETADFSYVHVVRFDRE